MSSDHRASPHPSRVPATPTPNGHSGASSSTQRVRASEPLVSQSSNGGTQGGLNLAYLQDLLLKLASCSSIGEVLRLLPVPVQPVSRDILDGVYQASLKLGGAEALLVLWKDHLRSGRFDEIVQLNSLKAPSVQVCKEALGPDDGGLSALNLDGALRVAKESALKAMITIKELEVANLQSFVQPANIQSRLVPAWSAVVAQNAATITTEHSVVLGNEDVQRKVCQVAASIGESSSQRARLAKEKRVEMRKEADVDMTDGSVGKRKKEFCDLQKTTQQNAETTGTEEDDEEDGRLTKRRKQQTQGPQRAKAAREALSLFPSGLVRVDPRFFKVSPLARKMYVWTQLTENDLETLMSWRPGVHKEKGIILPREVEYSLSLNLKFLYPQRQRDCVVWNWFDALVRKSKLAWIFRNRRQDVLEGLPAVPFVRNPTWQPVIKSHWFNQGVESGRRLLQLQLARPIPELSTGRSDVFRRVVLSPQALADWLTKADLLCFISDKNLGIVVTTRNWYLEQVKKFIELPVFESFIGDFPTFHHLVERQLSELFADVTDETKFWISPKVQKFLDQAEHRKAIPQFHGIPKIHKNPWKIRPIVPMHSYVTSTLSIVLHNLLLPIQRSFSWICESSRELCEEVRTFNQRGLSVRLHTGDVSAMYTSIPWVHFKVALRSVVERYPPYQFNRALSQWILRAAEILWENTVFQLANRLFHQTDGVPMGIHCGPVFANLYLAFYERHYLERFDGLYRRYIDDIFVLHQSDDVVSQLIVAPGMDISWEHSGIGLSFLDVWFHTHIGSPEICYRPYEKVGNHHQYLPWDSSHPTSVKKGLVKGELTRASSISYRQPYFQTWKATFLSRLISRGWPRRAVRNWGRQVQWKPRHAEYGTARAKRGDFIIAISQYNPAWEKVSSSDIWTTMLRTWRRCAPADKSLPFPQHVMVSKKRTKSLWDTVRSVNRSLLHTEYEETYLEDVQSDLSTMDLDELPFEVPRPFQGSLPSEYYPEDEGEGTGRVYRQPVLTDMGRAWKALVMVGPEEEFRTFFVSAEWDWVQNPNPNPNQKMMAGANPNPESARRQTIGSQSLQI
ncbi:hypothetical protein SLEP1_g60062, partial [Rubroshorea leprosula]